MSELTFNIADYRPLGQLTIHDRGPIFRERSGMVVVSSNSDLSRPGRNWVETAPAVVEIRSASDSHRSIPRRGKVLRFSNPASHRLYMMPVQHDAGMPADDDPGPLVA
jgi:hypothetical protein